jgi:hypothetical protein
MRALNDTTLPSASAEWLVIVNEQENIRDISYIRSKFNSLNRTRFS